LGVWAPPDEPPESSSLNDDPWWRMCVGRRNVDVVTVTCLSIGEYVGVVGAEGDSSEIFVAETCPKQQSVV
jgi:hypothetical protein